MGLLIWCIPAGKVIFHTSRGPSRFSVANSRAILLEFRCKFIDRVFSSIGLESRLIGRLTRLLADSGRVVSKGVERRVEFEFDIGIKYRILIPRLSEYWKLPPRL